MLYDTLIVTSKIDCFFQLGTSANNINILHIGNNDTIINSLASENIIHPLSMESISNDLIIDIILINDETDISINIINQLNDRVNVVIKYTYKKIKYNTNLIHYTLIPTLIQYAKNIKNNFCENKILPYTQSVFINKLKRTINKNIDDSSLNIGKLSSLMHMSRSSLSKQIKEQTGMKPTEFINSFKVEKGKDLLVSTNWQICEISDCLGFSSQHYFSRIFKKSVNKSPLQYRSEKQNATLYKNVTQNPIRQKINTIVQNKLLN